MSNAIPQDSEFYPLWIRNLARGLAAQTPDVLTQGGVKAVGKIVFTGNIIATDTVTVNGVAFTAKAAAAPAVGKIVFTGDIIAGDTVTINGVVFTCMASGAAGELQFDVGGSLSLSLDALATKLNACTNVLVSYATYTKTDTNTAITSTSDTNNAAHNGIVLSSTHSTVVVTAPVNGVTTATSVEFHVGGTLSLSLDALATVLNASANVLVSRATYTKTDTNSAITWTSDNYGTADNSVVLASTHSTVVVTQPVGGQETEVISLATANTDLQIGADEDVAQHITLADGVEFQEKFIAATVFDGAGTVVVTPANLAGGTTIEFSAVGDWVQLKFIAGEWYVMDYNSVTVA